MSCETATKTITEIYGSPDIDECISKLVTRDLRKDFKQELFVILLSIPCEKVDQMNGTFKYFVVRIILNLVRQKRNIFHKTYLDKTIEYNTDKLNYESCSPADRDIINERIERERAEDMKIQELIGIDEKLGNTDYPYFEKTIRLINKYGSLSEASRQTGIPKTTIHRIVKKIKGHINQ